MSSSGNGRRFFVLLGLLFGALAFPSQAKADYYAEGTVLSTNLLANSPSVTAISSVAVTATVPANTTVSVKYSQDNVNFYNAAGTKEGWDTVANGGSTIDISSRGWTGSILYYKLKLTTTDVAATPTVSDVAVNFTGSAVPAQTATRYQRQGVLRSTNVLTGAGNVTSINSVAVTTTLFGGTTVGIKYSQDNVNFYNAAGVKDGLDNCAQGTNTINISALGWSGGILYYELVWTSVDDEQTPSVSDVTVDYTGEVAQPPNCSGHCQTEGAFVSTDLLVGIGKAMRGTEYFAYSIPSLPGGTSVKASFSQDGTNWYSSNGTLWGEDTLSSGLHMQESTALSLSGLNWADGTHFYYKLHLATVDDVQTPVVTYAGLLFAQSTTINASQEGKMTNGLVGYWPFNGKDVSGTTAYDRSGQGNDGTLTNGPTVTEGRSGQALTFNGSNQSINCGVLATKPATSVTVSSWIKKTGSSTDQWLIVNGRDGLHYTPEFIFEIDPSGRVAFFDYNQAAGGYGFSAATSHSTNAVNDGLWHHIAFTKNGVNGIFYVDGVANGTSTAAINIDYSSISGPLAIGGDIRDSGSYYFGAIDEPRIYNRALSASEIWDLYQLGNPDHVNAADLQADPLEKGMVGYWKLDDASGTSATDSSGNANTGTLTNGPTWTTGQIGGATSFDGTDDYATTGASSDIAVPNTMAAWVHPSSHASAMHILGGVTGNNGFALQQYPSTYTVGITEGGNLFFSPSYEVPLNTWTHLAVVNVAGLSTLYVNGAKQSTITGYSLHAYMKYIGMQGSATAHFNGSIDEVRIYNRALSADEVAKLYKTTAPDNPDTGLVGYWSFNGKDLSGTTAYDRSGKGNNGTLTNGPTVTEGKAGQALNFDGTNDYVDAGTNAALSVTGSMTISAWINPRTFGDNTFGRIVDKSDLTNHGYSFLLNNNPGGSPPGTQTLNLAICSGGTCSTGGANANSITLNQWQHVVAVYDASTPAVTFYVNGAASGGYAPSNALDAASASFKIGDRQDLSRSFDGSIDEVRIYNRALSATEITALYNAGR